MALGNYGTDNRTHSLGVCLASGLMTDLEKSLEILIIDEAWRASTVIE